jgi:hypothetical protein
MHCPNGHGLMIRGQKAWVCEECGHRLPVTTETPTGVEALADLDLAQLPYPVALTGQRLVQALETPHDALKVLFLLKDCLEASIKYLGVVLLIEYGRSPFATPERNEELLKKLVRPSLGVWVNAVVGDLSLLLEAPNPPAVTARALFAGQEPGRKLQATPLLERCRQFVEYRNDALGHGAMRSDRAYQADLAGWLPTLRELLQGIAAMAPWRLCLVTDVDRCQVWMGPGPAAATEPGVFRREQVGHFVLRGPAEGSAVHDLYPFLAYLPDPDQQNRLHFYDSVYRYQATRKEATVLEYDSGQRHPRTEPMAGLEEAFTAELLAKAFKWHRGRMVVIEGRVANFGEILETHAAIVGRRFAIEHVQRFVTQHGRGLLVIEAEPGKGKTALLAHLIEEVFGQQVPRPVHFFYRRTAGITDPDVCVRSLYHKLLEVHDLTESEEAKRQTTPEEVYHKLIDLLGREIAPRLSPGRPQLIFLDALDEADRNAFLRIPESLPAGVYIIASTRPVSERHSLARRQYLHWFNLDAPDLVQENLRDGWEYVHHHELVGSDLSQATLDEVARLGAGNFLVLKLLCQHLRTTLAPEQAGGFLRLLATDGGKDQLGFIYAEFWERLTERCSLEEANLLCDVAGVLVTAYAPLTADMICGVLGLRVGDWDFALRHLAEYLTVVEHDEEGIRESFYRIYHESFADFLRTKLAPGRVRVVNLLANYCVGWPSRAEGYPLTYGLRFGPAHLRDAGRLRELGELATDDHFLEAVRRHAGGLHQVRESLEMGLTATLVSRNHGLLRRGLAEARRLLTVSSLTRVDYLGHSFDAAENADLLLLAERALGPTFAPRYSLLLAWRALRAGEVGQCRQGVAQFLNRSDGYLAYEEAHLFASFFFAAWQDGVPGVEEAWLRVYPPHFAARGILESMRRVAPALPPGLWELYERLRFQLQPSLIPPEQMEDLTALAPVPRQPNAEVIDRALRVAARIEAVSTRIYGRVIELLLDALGDLGERSPEDYAMALGEELNRQDAPFSEMPILAEILGRTLDGQPVPVALAEQAEVPAAPAIGEEIDWLAPPKDRFRAANAAETAALMLSRPAAETLIRRLCSWMSAQKHYVTIGGGWIPFREGQSDDWLDSARTIHAALEWARRAEPRTDLLLEVARGTRHLTQGPRLIQLRSAAAAALVRPDMPPILRHELLDPRHPCVKIDEAVAQMLALALHLSDNLELACSLKASSEELAPLFRAADSFNGRFGLETISQIAETLIAVKHPSELPFGAALAGLYCPSGVELGPLLPGLPACAERDFLLYVWAWRAGGAKAVRVLSQIDSTHLRAAAALASLGGDKATEGEEGLPTRMDASALELVEGMMSVAEKESAVRAIIAWATRPSATP